VLGADYEKCAVRIVDALRLTAGEKVILKLDPRIFTGLVTPLQKRIRETGAHVSAVILAEDTSADSGHELMSLRKLFADADVFIWLPELHQGNRPALARALNEWLDARRGPAVHFHWHSGAYPIGFMELPQPEVIDRT